MDRRMLLAGAAALAALGGGLLWWRRRAELSAFLSAEEFSARHAEPLPPPAGPMTVYHLGHSLVGRDMPAMLAQLAGHTHHSQLGWGASLKQHWEPDEPVPGFDTENAHPAHRPAREAIASGGYDAVILTEMVEIRDAIRYHDSGRCLAEWARAARAANPDVRIYLYETWHRLDDPAGWTDRIRDDLPGQWEAIMRKAMAQEGTGTIHLIPAGTAMAALVARIEAGEVPGLARREDLFGKNPDGTQDMIHPNDLGAYFVALVHYATLYHRSPEGMPHALIRADGRPADAPSPEAARIMAQVAWQTVSGYAATGVAP
ncbi:hypothetical protein E7811_10205 [Aliigemmobacter aestuarii]|uniref:SGNH/GDSL hydrolase family protein n=1 Tax=Aliigemmobacter aestuarii TaxID=1445661 RepID=A0A4S3MMU6_9RHOB|nr:hypothetical protein [Gemmobacter aestuarii]THD83639.1 hypothetical protein E7811_10205 [Gemmobacter aestuarii]